MRFKCYIQVNDLVYGEGISEIFSVDTSAQDVLEMLSHMAKSYTGTVMKKEIIPIDDDVNRYINALVLFPNKTLALSFAADIMSRAHNIMTSYYEEHIYEGLHKAKEPESKENVVKLKPKDTKNGKIH